VGRKRAKAPPGDGLGGSLSKSSATLAALTMKGGDAWQKIVVYCCYLISALALFAISVPPYETPKQLTCLIVSVVTLVVALVLVIMCYQRLTREEPAPVPLPEPPPLPIPANIRLQTPVRDKMFEVLGEARRLVLIRLQQKNTALEDNHVRANIFMPDYDVVGNYVLKIRSGLHIHITDPELGITLEKGQGVTGHVLESGEARVAQRLPAAETGWDKTYQITPELAEVINPQLKWIVSMPLKLGDGKAIGVMNIDGLKHQFHVDDLYDCGRQLGQLAMVITGLAIGN
jgi:hypothetical protein